MGVVNIASSRVHDGARVNARVDKPCPTVADGCYTVVASFNLSGKRNQLPPVSGQADIELDTWLRTHNPYDRAETARLTGKEGNLNRLNQEVLAEHARFARSKVESLTWQEASITTRLHEDKNAAVNEVQADYQQIRLDAARIRAYEQAIREAGKEPEAEIKKIFTRYRKTHNDAVFDIYTPRIRAARSSHIITGLPDAYGRGRIIGDYRRVALYGVDYLIAEKEAKKNEVSDLGFSEHWARYREEHAEQIKALKKLKIMAESYGFDISGPAKTAHEAVQWTYFGYLASIKSQDGAAMSIGRLSAFFDCYFERDAASRRLEQVKAMEMEAQLAARTAQDRVGQAAGKGDAARNARMHRVASRRATTWRPQPKAQ